MEFFSFPGISTQTLFQATLSTLLLGISVATFAGVAGMALAWLTTRTEVVGRSKLSNLLALPYALPPYLLGMAWVILGNPTVGFFKDFLPATGSYGFWGMSFVLASVAFAFPFLEIRAGFSQMDPALEEAARMSGAKPSRVFWNVSLPLLWPSLLNGMCLSFLYSISAFGVPALLGMPVRKYVLTTLIYSQIRIGGMDGIASGLKLSMILLALAGAVLFLSNRLTKVQKQRMSAISGAKSSRPSIVKLGKWKWPLTSFAWSFLGITVLLPWVALAFSALAPIAGKYSPSLWTTKNLVYVLGLSDFKEALFNSTILAVTISALTVFMSFVLAFYSERKQKPWAHWIIETLGVPFSTPGTVLAIVIIVSFTWMSRMGLPMDSALVMMAAAYSLKFAALSARATRNAFRQVHPALEEAARVSGAKTATLLLTIWAPLLKKSLFASFFLSALPMFTELTMSILLTGPGGATLGTVLFQLQEYADQPSAAALAWMLLTVALVISFFMAPKERNT